MTSPSPTLILVEKKPDGYWVPRQWKWIQDVATLVARHKNVLLTAAAVTAVAIALAAMPGSPVGGCGGSFFLGKCFGEFFKTGRTMMIFGLLLGTGEDG